MKAVCFDLNKTLIEENSWRDLNIGLGVRPEEDDMLMDWGDRGIISDAQGQQILLKLYQSSRKHSKNNILKILSDYNYKLGAKELVEYLKKKGYVLFLVSGSMDILVEKVADELGIEHYGANNKFQFDDKGYLQDIVTLDNDKKAKLDQLKQLCKKTNVNLEDVYCIGDGENDIELFKSTGKGITFTGSKIENYAYKVVNNLDEIKDFL